MTEVPILARTVNPHVFERCTVAFFIAVFELTFTSYR